MARRSTNSAIRTLPRGGSCRPAKLLSEYYGGAVHPDRILLTASTSEAYSYLFKLLCDPGDEVLVPRPSYPLFDMLAQLESVRVVQYPLHYHEGWFIDIRALQDCDYSSNDAPSSG